MRRSGPLKRSQPLRRTGRLRPRSEKTLARQGERDACRRAVLARAGHRCQYATLVPEIECGYYPPRRADLEVDELHGGAARSVEQYDPDACRATCPAHHDWKTDHKRELLDRLDAWEERWADINGASSHSATASASPTPNATTSPSSSSGTKAPGTPSPRPTPRDSATS